jgi:hypothetical protein
MIRRSRTIRVNHEIHVIRENHEIPKILRWNRVNPKIRTIRRMSRSSRTIRTSDSAARPRYWLRKPTRSRWPVQQTASPEPFVSPPELKDTEPLIAIPNVRSWDCAQTSSG